VSLSAPETTPPLEPWPPPVDDERKVASPPPPGKARWGLWRHGDFVKLWTASTISLFGSQVSMIAIPAIAIITLNVSPFEAAMLGFFEMLPFILFTLPAGVWVDRLRRRPILIAGDVGRAIALATIPIAFAAGTLTIWQLYLVGFVTGIMTVFFDVADQSYLPSLLEADQLVEGNSKLQVSVSAAQIGGQGVGGAIIGLVTAPFAVLADAVSFLASAVLIFLIRKPENPPPERRDGAAGNRGPGMRTEIAEGLRYVLGNRYLRNIAASTGTLNLFNSLMFSIFFVYVFRTLELSPLTIGLVGGLGNTGFLLGAVIAGRLARRIGVGRSIVLASAFAGAKLLIPLAPESSAAIPFIFVSMFVVSSMVVIYNVNQVSLRQAITPERMQGRMNATMRFIVWGTMPIGIVVGGILGSTIGLHATLWVGAIGGCFAFVPVLLSPVRSLREIPTEPV
jgi:MFS family permease